MQVLLKYTVRFDWDEAVEWVADLQGNFVPGRPDWIVENIIQFQIVNDMIFVLVNATAQ